ncbi:cold shock domain-containing protein [Yinghuangia sp. ASG 101]|uniref:cold-shock protein n=1 Tax=Yinghuangia sp. ASG 101 TaxID=2896848 RepID=UPI001E37C65E|nr:cold shock domain-containing protein [Yinghuangia sp. ASG 101]UGQ14150.1 cold shock domain-containing protein [Yinghuangia sp. ASG 101]
MQGTVHTFDAATGAGSVLLDDGTAIPFPASAFAASGLRLLRPGQRVRIDVSGEGPDRVAVFVTIATLRGPGGM